MAELSGFAGCENHGLRAGCLHAGFDFCMFVRSEQLLSIQGRPSIHRRAAMAGVQDEDLSFGLTGCQRLKQPRHGNGGLAQVGGISVQRHEVTASFLIAHAMSGKRDQDGIRNVGQLRHSLDDGCNVALRGKDRTRLAVIDQELDLLGVIIPMFHQRLANHDHIVGAELEPFESGVLLHADEDRKSPVVCRGSLDSLEAAAVRSRLRVLSGQMCLTNAVEQHRASQTPYDGRVHESRSPPTI